ncbi:MAG: D-alanyl-D-alanine carboxypeptidase [Gammaproteobacteria bacterium]|nr:D-alanyl-D-alanine carboxypeptidase [Gammaproteobacteria bacterium]
MHRSVAKQGGKPFGGRLNGNSKRLRELIACALATAITPVLAAPAAPAAPIIVPAAPAVAASAYLVQDHDSGRILVEHQIDARVEPASLTKMMTAYVVENELAAGKIGPDDPVRISEKAWRMEGPKMFVEVNKEVTVRDLMRGVIIQSGNDASVALAEHVAGSEEAFAAMMNEHAQRLGMNGTNYRNSTGWPEPEHYTTARDLAILGSALFRDFPEGYRVHAEKEFVFNGIRQRNRNDLLWTDSSIDGIKTGHTESAGYCLVASGARDGMRLISVVMGTAGPEARANATTALMNYAFRFYESRTVVRGLQPLTTGKVWKGVAEGVTVGLLADLRLAIPRGAEPQLEKLPILEPRIVAPVKRHAAVGTLSVRLNGKELAARPLIALDGVDSAGLLGRVADDLRLLFE